MGYNAINPEPEKDRHVIASRGTSRLIKDDKRIYDTPTGLPYDQDPEKDNDFVTESNIPPTPDLPTILVEGYPSGSSQISGGGGGGGGGITEVVHDATLTGRGTTSSPLSVVPQASTDTSWGSINGNITDQADLMAKFDSTVSTDSPTFTGSPQAPTPPAGSNDTSIATTEYVIGYVNGTDLTDTTSDVNSLVITPSSPTARVHHRILDQLRVMYLNPEKHLDLL